MSVALQLSPGTIFAGDFRIVQPLAEGGMGSVYVVEQVSTGNQRALKVMHASLFTDQRLRERFVQEAKIGAKIESDHVVQVVGAGVDAPSGMPWLAMELLRGETLADALTRRGVFTPGELREIYSQLFHALIGAHEAGIVHRDLKPENIFLAASRREGVSFMTKVLDFGIAKLVAEANTRATAAIGTPLWMAPEQTEVTSQIRPTADCWALGLIAFQALTGRYYWKVANSESVSTMSLLREVLMEPVVSASQRAAELGVGHLLPQGFDGWFARCVERNVDVRYANAGHCKQGFDLVFSAYGPAGISGNQYLSASTPQNAMRAATPPSFAHVSSSGPTPHFTPAHPMQALDPSRPYGATPVHMTPAAPVTMPAHDASAHYAGTPPHFTPAQMPPMTLGTAGTVMAAGAEIPVIPPPPGMPTGPGMTPARKGNGVLIAALVTTIVATAIGVFVVTRPSADAETKVASTTTGGGTEGQVDEPAAKKRGKHTSKSAKDDTLAVKDGLAPPTDDAVKPSAELPAKKADSPPFASPPPPARGAPTTVAAPTPTVAPAPTVAPTAAPTAPAYGLPSVPAMPTFVAPAAPPPPAPTPAPTTDTASFKPSAARAALDSVNWGKCHGSGSATLAVTFSPGGKAISVRLVSGTLDDESSNCVQRQAGTARMTPFTGAPDSITYTKSF